MNLIWMEIILASAELSNKNKQAKRLLKLVSGGLAKALTLSASGVLHHGQL